MNRQARQHAAAHKEGERGQYPRWRHEQDPKKYCRCGFDRAWSPPFGHAPDCDQYPAAPSKDGSGTP